MKNRSFGGVRGQMTLFKPSCDIRGKRLRVRLASPPGFRSPPLPAVGQRGKRHLVVGRMVGRGFLRITPPLFIPCLISKLRLPPLQSPKGPSGDIPGPHCEREAE